MLAVSVTLPIHYVESDLLTAISKMLRISPTLIKTYKIIRRSIDARKKNTTGVVYCLVVYVSVDNEASISKRSKCPIVDDVQPYQPRIGTNAGRVIIVGCGPAGLFCALALSEAGVKVTLIERGSDVDKRIESVDTYLSTGKIDTNTNVQFGEGGAGTFSDGKLTTGIKNPRISYVLDRFVTFGAPSEIVYESKPHIGTDKLRNVVKNIRNKILSLGGEVLFNTRLTDIDIVGGKVQGITCVRDGEEIYMPCDKVVLAIGHSARDTYKMIYDKGIKMVSKPFSIGVRIEHKRENINLAQYGDKRLTADYKLATHLPNGRGVYTFCMCPGGVVIPSSSDEGEIVTNGMSNYLRDADNSNSALLVGIDSRDYGEGVLDGMYYQQKYERLAYASTGSMKAPCQTVGNLLYGSPNEIDTVKPSYAIGVEMRDMRDILPREIVESLKEGISIFGKSIKGFDDKDALLTGVETRSSSPIRILRDDSMCSENIVGLYPCGEGAGYAGGITSSAVDGVNIAEALSK